MCTYASTQRRCPSIDARSPGHEIDRESTLLYQRRSHTSFEEKVPDEATAAVSQITLKHDEISLHRSQLSGKMNLVPTSDRHHGTRLQARAIGVQFNWTLSQEVVFSAALTGKPRRRNKVGLCVSYQ